MWGLDQNPPISSAIFQVLGLFLTSNTCIVTPRKKGCFHKSPRQKGLRRSNLTLLVAVYGNLVRFSPVKKDGPPPGP